MKKLAYSVALIAAASVSGTAMATEGWYGGLGMGANLLHNQDLEASGGGAQGPVATTHDLGIAGNLSAGYGFTNGFRLELENGYKFNQINDMRGSSGPDSGDTEAFSWILNGYYDFKNPSAFTPYVGAGVGAMLLQLNDYVVPASAVPAGSTAQQRTISQHELGYVAQGIAGMTYNFSNYVDLYADYRYLRSLSDFEFNTGSTGPKSYFDSDYGSSSFLVGLRVRPWGGSPRPAVTQPQIQPWRPTAPKPAPAPITNETMGPRDPQIRSRSYLVFFDFDRKDLTSVARDVISKAVLDAKGVEVIRFEVTGHADRSGKESYNDRLSMRRAEEVKHELIGMGVPEHLISVYAKGENQPLVPTEDGVKEPQNRRVEIVYTVSE
jgi:OOP family OmpA-OmpF porin